MGGKKRQLEWRKTRQDICVGKEETKRMQQKGERVDSRTIDT